MKRLLLFLMIACLTTTAGFAQKAMQISNAFLYGVWIDYNYGAWIGTNNYMNNSLWFQDVKNPFLFDMDIQVVTPVNVKYVLYTFKKTFSQDGKRGYVQGIDECGLVNPITTQAQIDANLDKIYEFPVVTENTSMFRQLSWDGYTDPQFTGQKYPVRDCIYIAAYNADTGELIDTQGVAAAINYQTISNPGIVYRIDEQKDSDGKVVKETLSGKVLMAFPDDWPIKKITALLTCSIGCGFGATPISVVNQGGDAIVANINSRIPGEVAAHITLTNPTVDPDNPDIKIYDWKDIKTEDGKDFIPDLIKNPDGYTLAIIIDMDEMTFTGVKNGFICGTMPPVVPPVPKIYTGINSINADKDVKIYSDGSGNIIVNCPDGVYAMKYRIFDISGKALETGNIAGGKIETATRLNKGNIYIIQVDTDNSTVTRKVIIK